MESRNIQYLPGLDHLRGMAAALVIFYHGRQLISHRLRTGLEGFSASGDWLYSRNPLLSLVAEGHAGVSLFIVLSGFVFTYGCYGKAVSYRDFIANRIWRIVPLATFVAVFGLYLYPASYSVLGFLQLLLLQGNYLPGHLNNPFVAMLWTLCVEMQFYLVFPFLIRFYERRGSRYLILLIVGCLAMRTIGFLHTGIARDSSYFTIVGRIDQFLIGMLVGGAYLRYERIRKHSRLSFVAALALLLTYLRLLNAYGGWPKDGSFWVVWPICEAVVWAIFLLAYLNLCPSVPAPLARSLAAAGRISFSTYLLHFPILIVLVHTNWLIPFSGHGSRPALLNTTFVLLPLTYALSAVTYSVIERPFLQFRRMYVSSPNDRVVQLRTAEPPPHREIV